MTSAKIDIEKREEVYSSQRKWKAFAAVLLFHTIALFALAKFGFNRTYPPPPLQGIEIAIEVERPRPQGVPRRNQQQRPVNNPSIVNAPGNTAPPSARIDNRNESTKPAPQPETKPSELSDQGDIPVEAPEPKINNKALFTNTSTGEEEATNQNPIDDDSQSTGSGRSTDPTRTSDTDDGPEHRLSVTLNLSGRAVVGEFPKPSYRSNEQGIVIVEVTVNRDGIVTKATATAKGSTVQDSRLWRAAEKAALEARFDIKKDAPISQLGTIKYIFSLK
jgi:TonB family protein